MDKILKQIADREVKHNPVPTKKPAFVFASWKKITDKQWRKQWYKIGKIVKKGHKVQLHKKSKLFVWRIYEYYSIDKENWVGLSPKQLGKMYEINIKFKESKSETNIGSTSCWTKISKLRVQLPLAAGTCWKVKIIITWLSHVTSFCQTCGRVTVG